LSTRKFIQEDREAFFLKKTTQTQNFSRKKKAATNIKMNFESRLMNWNLVGIKPTSLSGQL